MKKFIVLIIVLILMSTSTSYAATKRPSDVTIVIDAGHQGPVRMEGSKPIEGKVVMGTQGVSTGKPEYEVNLEVALKLEAKLKSYGYKVVITRKSNKVDISNEERAAIANKAKADLFVVLHADGNKDSKFSGTTIFFPEASIATSNNVLHTSYDAGKVILKTIIAETKAVSRGVYSRKDLILLKKTEVPIVFIEMGFLTNPTEDKLLANSQYQDKIVTGILKGINAHFNMKAPVKTSTDTKSTSGQVAGKMVALAENVKVYHKLDNKTFANIILTPQKIEYVEKKGNWYRVKILSETKWIYIVPTSKK